MLLTDLEMFVCALAVLGEAPFVDETGDTWPSLSYPWVEVADDVLDLGALCWPLLDSPESEKPESWLFVL